ncbi:MAG: tRNA (5-methylaminomethyl-2-thiouridine)(34)-methyltransferase MnmD [Flavobacteriales bacterium]
MKRTLTRTADGSFTIYVPELDEHYHSIHGALQEANHVFIQNGVSMLSHKKSIRVLEMGLGTALNAYLTYEWSKKHNIEVWYCGVEAYPVGGQLITTCLTEIGVDQQDVLSFFSSLTYGETKSIGHFRLEPVQAFWADLSVEDSFDVIFYDAFGPRAQEEMWTIENFEIAFKALKSDGILVTYCAKGQVKRDLKFVGFKVESRPGPPGKREMTIAFKP